MSAAILRLAIAILGGVLSYWLGLLIFPPAVSLVVAAALALIVFILTNIR